MNKLLIGLLIVAAGAGVFFFLRKKEKNDFPKNEKLSVTGKWQLHAPGEVIDTIYPLYQYHFMKDGQLIQSLKDSSAIDTMYFDFNASNQLVWKQNKADSASRVFNVVLLTKDSLRIEGPDSIPILLTRIQ
jgi:hypothetical protein